MMVRGGGEGKVRDDGERRRRGKVRDDGEMMGRGGEGKG